MRAINEAYEREGLPIHIEHFSSFFPTFTGSSRFAALFQYYLRERGVHTNPPSPSFLSPAHSEADIEVIVDAYVETGRAMGQDGLLDAPASSASREQTRPEGAIPVPVLPNVARFLLERDTPEPHHWNLGVLLRTERRLDPDVVRQALKHLMERHDALRLRFSPSGRPGRRPSRRPMSRCHSTIATSPSCLRKHGGRPWSVWAAEAQGSLDLRAGPIFRTILFDLGASEQRLLVIIHHFAMDGISWRPFWEDFEGIYKDVEREDAVSLSPASTSFEEWARVLESVADSEELREDEARWLALPWDRVRPIPVDHDGDRATNTNASARQVSLDFSIDETNQLLLETPNVPHKTDCFWRRWQTCWLDGTVQT